MDGWIRERTRERDGWTVWGVWMDKAGRRYRVAPGNCIMRSNSKHLISVLRKTESVFMFFLVKNTSPIKMGPGFRPGQGFNCETYKDNQGSGPRQAGSRAPHYLQFLRVPDKTETLVRQGIKQKNNNTAMAVLPSSTAGDCTMARSLSMRWRQAGSKQDASGDGELATVSSSDGSRRLAASDTSPASAKPAPTSMGLITYMRAK
uniref:Uncharacterized protein n=1 Tax=Oryza punctata TaxID=4537 RepID=A0A0E0JI51_ORYPU